MRSAALRLVENDPPTILSVATAVPAPTTTAPEIALGISGIGEIKAAQGHRSEFHVSLLYAGRSSRRDTLALQDAFVNGRGGGVARRPHLAPAARVRFSSSDQLSTTVI